jgi:hypothetical protein
MKYSANVHEQNIAASRSASNVLFWTNIRSSVCFVGAIRPRPQQEDTICQQGRKRARLSAGRRWRLVAGLYVTDEIPPPQGPRRCAAFLTQASRAYDILNGRRHVRGVRDALISAGHSATALYPWPSPEEQKKPTPSCSRDAFSPPTNYYQPFTQVTGSKLLLEHLHQKPE